MNITKFINDEWQGEERMEGEYFRNTSDAIFDLFEQVCMTKKPSKKRIYDALYFLGDRHPGSMVAGEHFKSTSEAVNELFEQLCMTSKPSKQRIYDALYYLGSRHPASMVAEELEEIGPDWVSFGK
jgi:hypothetical protein